MSDNKKSPQAGGQEGKEKRKLKILPSYLTEEGHFVNIPDELKEHYQWVCWRYEKQNEKLTKVPIAPFSGQKASTTDPMSWNSFENASKYTAKNNVAGIGFVFTDEDPYCGIDLDACRNLETAKISDLAQEIIQRFDSYTEISPSGEGVHIIIKGKLPERGRKNPALGIEVYDSKRYFTITGNVLDGRSQIQERQPELDAFLPEYFKGEPPETNEASGRSTGIWSHLTDEEIIERAIKAANGNKFKQLWEKDWQGAGYNSQSEADAALCVILGFYVGTNPERIDKLFRQSGLYRDKWERLDYRERTIQKSLDLYTQENNAANNLPIIEKQRSTSMLNNDEVLKFPDIMSGMAGNFVEVYSSYTEAPKPFLYMCHLTCLGSVLADKVILDSELKPQPRLYLMLLGESADDRKSTAIKMTTDFFKEVSPKFNICWGVGSAEGLQAKLKDTPSLLLCFDEFKQFVSKCKIESSVLLPCVNTLFESNTYESRTRSSAIFLENTHLSLLAASTTQTYERIWDPSFTDIGFNNRLFIVPAKGERKFSLPPTIPEEEKRKLRAQLGAALSGIGNQALRLQMSPDAKLRYDDWYMNREQSIHSKRLDTYASRFMAILTVNEGKDVADKEVVEKAIELCDWQLKVRKLYDPIDADNKIAHMEENIRRQLSGRGSLKKSDLKRFVNANRAGLWFYDTALNNLQKAGEVQWDSKKKQLHLVQI
jgi:hypothetical protein